jgi:hypothetical protein
MMDIIERLRKHPYKSGNASEAADEIERLRKQLKQCIWSETEYCKTIEADNARLREVIIKMTNMSNNIWNEGAIALWEDE